MSRDVGGRVRVVVTGMGAVTPLGKDVAASWDACRRGRPGIVPISLCDVSDLATHIAGEVKGFDPVDHLGAKEARRTSRCVALGVAAAREAVTDSGLDIGTMPDDVGVLVASGLWAPRPHPPPRRPRSGPGGVPGWPSSGAPPGRLSAGSASPPSTPCRRSPP